ncbi:MAG: SDR family oxidoreductase [Arthrobacter sp.]|jgi:NAD(P)-dependent dehydrogenase (short-subunit alcohol dehydrogenase family)|nr:SDR family oxidoreductase [Arthrobacter sp.]
MSSDRLVLITGGAGGIGAALAQAFLDAGDRVVLLDREAEALAARAAELGTAHAVVDITDPDSVRAAVAAIAAEHGTPDVLVNNAGLLSLHGPVLGLAPEDYKKILDVNVVGTFTVTQAVAAAMVEAGRPGAVVNISSIGASQPTPGMGGYESSKAAVDAQTRWAAIELAAHGIRVNAVAPGPVLTPMMAMAMPEGSEARSAWTSRIPLAQMAAPEDVAAAAVFVASAAAKHLTGIVIPVDGGQLLG